MGLSRRGVSGRTGAGRRVLQAILILAAGGLVLVTVFALAARFWWAFDLFSHFRLQYLILAVLFCLLALALRAHVVAAVLVAVALVHGWAIKDLWLGGTPVPAAALPLRVASVNVLDSNPTPGKVAAFARASDADLLIVVDAQSARWRDTLAAIGGLYPHRAPATWANGAPVILFSRLPILQHEVIRPADGRRPYLLTEVAVGRQPVTVAGVHPTSPSPTEPDDSHARNGQLDQIGETVEDEPRPVIVAGDFNTSPWSPHFHDLLAETGLRHAAAGHGWIATWPSWFWPARVPIDHILIRGSVAAAAVKRGPFVGSDHYPVLAELRLAASRPASERPSLAPPAQDRRSRG